VEVPLEDRIVRGSVKRLDPAADPQTGLFRAIIAMPPDRALLPGATVEARILVKRSLGKVVLPSGIIQREGDESFVYVVSGDRVQRRVVTLGEGADDLIEIRSGLKPGETVVAEGSSALYDGARIWVQPAGAASGEVSP